MKVLQVLHLLRKNEPEVLQVHAAPATQNEPEVLQVLRLPRKNKAAPKVINYRRTSAYLYEGAASDPPATQNKPEVLQVLHLPRKTSRRCSKCCACLAKRSGAQSNQLSPDFCGPESDPSAAPVTQNEPEVLQVLHLPRKTSRRCSKCCTCHAKRT